MGEMTIAFTEEETAAALQRAVEREIASLETRMETTGGILKRESVDTEALAYFKRSNEATRRVIADLRAVGAVASKIRWDLARVATGGKE